MQLRRVEFSILIVAAAMGGSLAPASLSGDPGRLLVTFLGIVAASILPTITLLINSMTASIRSIKAISELKDEIDAAMDALFLMFGCVSIAVMALISIAIDPPEFIQEFPLVAREVLPRLGQATFFVALGMVFLRIGQIPAILRKTLLARYKISVIEARKLIAQKAPSASEVQSMFKNNEQFGRAVEQEGLAE